MQAENARGPAAVPEPLRILLGLGLDYLRWVSLTPMVVVWAFYLFMVVFMVYVNFEDSVWDGVERGYETYSEWFGPIDWIEEQEADYVQQQAERERDPDATEPPLQEPVEFDLGDVMPWIMKAWGIIALAAWLFSLLRSLVFGSRPPRTLAQKLRVVVICVLVGWALLFVAYFFGTTTYQGSFFGWFAFFTGMAIIVMVVSAVVLMVSELFELLRRQLEPERRAVLPGIADSAR
ncbi:hypothetical protein [Wenzhouxiangella sp. EGI_FJ10409]|uniref:hypothetical protein n=1 Tax=Wenzhouxiangella sp. EGI_FJ10409 TaxID=3243767 RepID=UPI0035D790BC